MGDNFHNVLNNAAGLEECLRSLSDVDLRRVVSLFVGATADAGPQFHFRGALEDAANTNQFTRTILCIFHFILHTNGAAARTLVDREVIRRFLAR